MIDNGERMIPGSHKGQMVYGEHLVRYEAVASLVKDQNILDIACGSGYGSKILASHAKTVTGVDVSKESVAYASKTFSGENIEYIQGSATHIPAKDNAFDSIVSFETIEHIDDYKKFVAEAKRVLKPNGVFIVSTPNDDEFSEENEFHLHEFRLSEFKKLLSTHFKNIDLYYQGTWLYTALLSDQKFGKEWDDKIRTLQTLNQDTNKAVYFVAVCSDGATPKPPEVSAISQPWSLRDEQEQRKASENQVVDLSNRLESSRKELDDIYTSKAWHYVTKIRQLKHLFKLKR